jgi:hypothetical protein
LTTPARDPWRHDGIATERHDVIHDAVAAVRAGQTLALSTPAHHARYSANPAILGPSSARYLPPSAMDTASLCSDIER